MKAPVIALLTDFGLEDHYVASVKAVIMSINQQARMIDISHLVPPQDIRHGAFLLKEVYPYFPKGTIFLAVVDPGVGSSRRAICIRTNRGYLVGPDNGLLSLALQEERGYKIRRLENAAYFLKPVSAIFHGRDIFAPVAAWLSRKNIFPFLGPSLRTIQKIEWPLLRWNQNSVEGKIVHIDRFGNAISNISRSDIEAKVDFKANKIVVRVKSKQVKGICDFFAQGKKEPLIAVWNSSGFLELASPNRSAAQKFGLVLGGLVTLVFYERRL